MSNIDDVTKNIGDMLITDVFVKHGVNSQQKKAISEEQRQKVKSLIEDLQKQVDEFLVKQSKTTQVIGTSETAQSGQENTESAQASRKRIRLRRG